MIKSIARALCVLYNYKIPFVLADFEQIRQWWVPYNRDNDGTTYHASASQVKRKRPSSGAGELIPTITQGVVLSEHNFDNFKKALNKIDRHADIIKSKLQEEMKKIEEALTSDSDCE